MDPRTTPAPEGQSTLLPPQEAAAPPATDAANNAGQVAGATVAAPAAEKPAEPEAAKPSAHETIKSVVAQAAAKAAAKPAKVTRARRGPPADGVEEERVLVIMTTSKLQGVDGLRLRRGSAVSVPLRRLDGLIRSGKVRTGSAEAIEAARRRHGEGRIG